MSLAEELVRKHWDNVNQEPGLVAMVDEALERAAQEAERAPSSTPGQSETSTDAAMRIRALKSK